MVELQTINKHHRKEVHHCNRWIVINYNRWTVTAVLPSYSLCASLLGKVKFHKNLFQYFLKSIFLNVFLQLFINFFVSKNWTLKGVLITCCKKKYYWMKNIWRYFLKHACLFQKSLYCLWNINLTQTFVRGAKSR